MVYEDKNYIFEYNDKTVKVYDLISIAESYDYYVGARELDYRDGIRDNKKLIEKLKQLGVTKFVKKNHQLMFSETKEDWQLI